MILQAVLRGTIVIAVAALVAFLLRHRSAALRHHVWATAVVIQLSLLAFIPVMPTLHLPVIPTIRAQIETPLPTAGPATPVTYTSTEEPAQVAPVQNADQPSRFPDSPFPRTPIAWLTLIWLAGAALILARFMFGTLVMARVAVKGERVDDGEWLVLAQRTARELAITRPITMIWGDKVAVPITWGVLYPMILLPKSAQDWPQDRRRFVLVHEMAHVKRFDAFTQLLAQLTTAIFWFSPFVWLAEWRMRIEREHACDDTVIQHGTEPTRYANELLQMVRGLVRRRAPQPAFAALAMARKSEFEGRMLAILDPERPRRVTGVTSGLVFALLSVLIAAPLAALDPFAVRVETSPKASSVPPAAMTPASKESECGFTNSSNATAADVHDDGLSVRIKRGARCAVVDMSGPVRLSPDERRILAVEVGGLVKVREIAPARITQLFIERTALGGAQRAFTINGRAPDDDGRTEREWLARVMPELLTEGSINTQQRVLRMLKSNGLAATLRQIAAINSTSARLSHFTELVTIADWSAAELDRIRIAAHESLKDSPRDVAAFNRALPIRVSSEPVQRNATIPSDVELLDKILAGMTSNYDLSRAMLTQVANANRDVLLVFARHAGRMTSGYELRSFLIAAGQYFLGKDRAVTEGWFTAASNIESSYERRVALAWAVPRVKGDSHGTLMLLRATRNMSSGHDKSLLLAEVARQKLITSAELRSAFLTEVNSLSAGSDRRTVLEAM